MSTGQCLVLVNRIKQTQKSDSGRASVRSLLVALFAVAPLWVEAAELEGLRVWAGPDKTRAVLDLSEPVAYKLFTLSSPERVVVDIDQTQLKQPINVDANGLLSAVRTGRKDTTLRVVFDLTGSAKTQSFLLPPTGQYGHRLVIDLSDGTQTATKTVKTVAQVLGDETDRDVVIAIDPGHGGEDPGAIGSRGSYEKKVVYELALDLKRRIDQEPGMRAELTRTGDYYVDHRRRMELARQMRADLFVSLHADSFRDPKVSGSSVYVLSQKGASSEAAQWLAERENAADLVGGVSLDDKDGMLAAVLLDLSQSATMEQSTEAAQSLLTHLVSAGKVHRKRVEHAAFIVLKSPDIPSVLVETAFISNPDDERRLNDPNSRNKLVGAVFSGIKNFFYQDPPEGTWIAAQGGARSHIVSNGDTLSGIAAKHRVSLAKLRAVNDLKTDRLYVGSVLKIPTS